MRTQVESKVMHVGTKDIAQKHDKTTLERE